MRPISIRFADELHHRLKRRADKVGVPLSTLAQQAIDEWLCTVEHPGVIFRDGPTGRRAGLAAGPDVWEVAAVLRQQKGSPDQRVAAAATQLGLPIRHIEIAADYWAAHRGEIDGRIAANAEAAERELAAWENRRAVLGA